MTKENEEIEIKRIKSSHCMRLKIGRTGKPVLSLPYWIPKKMGLLWAHKQESWIQKNSFIPKHFYAGQTISFLGKEILIQHNDQQAPTHLENETLWVSGEEDFLPRRVADFIKKEFLKYLNPQIIKKEKILNVSHAHITLRDTSSRWGSCSSRGNLSFCWRLAMTPEFVIDYLISHEISHLKHMNHSKEFWKTVTLLTPYTSQAKKWLKEHGQEIPILK